MPDCTSREARIQRKNWQISIDSADGQDEVLRPKAYYFEDIPLFIPCKYHLQYVILGIKNLSSGVFIIKMFYLETAEVFKIQIIIFREDTTYLLQILYIFYSLELPKSTDDVTFKCTFYTCIIIYYVNICS